MHKILILVVVCVCTQAFPEGPPKTTIFSDERLKGEPFEKDYAATKPVARNTLFPSDYRLPNTTRPINYKVLWGIDIERQVFSGTVEIELEATQADVNEIVIHADDLEIASVTLRINQENTEVPQSFELEKELQFLRVILNAGVLAYNSSTPVVYRLIIDFGAVLRDDMSGIYKSWFKDDPNSADVSWMAATQFQATAARYALPCYDEPSFKATFDVTIRRPRGFYSWFCTLQRISRNSTILGYEEDEYYRTPRMSTYLLALVVADYETQALTKNDTLRYEVIGRPAAIIKGQGDYAFRLGQLLLEEMSNHTDLDFYSQHPYLKMTHASIPDFGAGAMENWGLLTYSLKGVIAGMHGNTMTNLALRDSNTAVSDFEQDKQRTSFREAYLMYDPEHTNYFFEQVIAFILSHEIAHMWFGNWVTNDWWDVLWLNEGFATYYEYFLTHWVKECMGLDTRFITEKVHTSLLSDSGNNPHPLTNPGVGSPDSIESMFSSISYNKGGSIIRMTEHLLGFDVHTQGLRNYLVSRALDTALPIHLFQELQNVAVASGAIAQYGPNFSVIDYYKSWTEQAGHPVLFVQVNHHTGQMKITQRRFNINSGFSSINSNWLVPITFATANNPDFESTKPTHILKKTVTVIDRGSTGDQWVIFNKQQTGYYRVNYDDYTWNLIVIALRGPNRTAIHEYNRAQIVNDVFQFARSGLMTYTRAFNILSFLENETEYAPWVAAMTGFNWLRNRFAGTNHLPRLESRIIKWATPIMNDLTYRPIANETFMRAYLRWQLAPVMCNMDVPACKEVAMEQFADLLDRRIEVPVNSRNWVYCNGLRNGTSADFDFLFERFRTFDVYTEKIQLLQTLGCTPHTQSLNKYLDAIINDTFLIRPQDYTTALNSASSGNEGNTRIVFDYMKANLANVTRAFRSASTPLSYVSSRLRTPAEVREFQAWANENMAALGDDFQSVYNNAESTLQGIVWASGVQDDLNYYLDNGDDEITASTPPFIPVTEPSTIPQPVLFEPVPPSLPGSANTSILSMAVFLVAFVVNFVF